MIENVFVVGSFVSIRHDAPMRCEIVAYLWPDKKKPRHYLAYAKPPPQSYGLTVSIMLTDKCTEYLLALQRVLIPDYKGVMIERLKY